MKIFNNWHQPLIFLSVTETTHEQRQGSALRCRNLPCSLPAPEPAASSNLPLEIAHVWKLLVHRHMKFGPAFSVPTQRCACTHACTRSVDRSERGCPAAILCIPLPASNPSFLCLVFLPVTLAWLWPWWPAESKGLSCSEVLWSHRLSTHISNWSWDSFRASSLGEMWPAQISKQSKKASQQLHPSAASGSLMPPPSFPNQHWHPVEVVNKTRNQAANICKLHFGK